MVTTEQLRAFCAAALNFEDGLEDALAYAEISDAWSLSAFMAQVAHESNGFRRTSESFDYSAAGLLATFGRYFSLESAANFGRHEGEAAVPLERQEAIANLVYADRLGNGDEASGDGWAFRGRGLIQLTGRDNYQCCGTAFGQDFLGLPDELADPYYAALSAGWYWRRHSLTRFTSHQDFTGLTRAINGAVTGLSDRQEWMGRALRVWQPTMRS